MQKVSSLFKRVVKRPATPSYKLAKIVSDERAIDVDGKSDRNDVFDGITRVLGSSMPRRQALRISFMGVIGVALAEAGLKTAWAAPECLCLGRIYDPLVECCTPSGVQRKKNNPNLAACPNKVVNPEYVCKPNGCGAEGGTKFPPTIGKADFLTCCGAPGTSGAGSHDCCWGKCGNDRDNCDLLFLACLDSACQTAYPGSGIIESIKRSACQQAAVAYYGGVSSFIATSAYESAQSGGCDCCAESTCAQTCLGGSCFNAPSCDNDFGCVCFQTVEGTGFCHRGQPCSTTSPCSSSSQCPQGWACVSVTCCGPQSICVQPCTVIGPAALAFETEGPTTTGF